MKSNFIVGCFVTKFTNYEEVWETYLKPSLEKLEIPYELYYTKNTGNWLQNVAEKPKIILEMLNKGLDRIVFLDADAEIKFYPELFDNIPDEYDIAVHYLDRNKWYGQIGEPFELLSGTLYLRNNDRVKSLVQEWYEKAIKKNQWEQRELGELLKERKDVKIYELPIEYCYIATLPNGHKPIVHVENPIIVHYQVSRKLKRLLKW
jgi:hypothetical protein